MGGILFSVGQNTTRVFVDVSRHTGTINKVQIQIEQESWNWLDATQEGTSDIWYYDITSYGDAANPAKVQYKWGIHDGTTTTGEDIGASCYGGKLEHDFVWDYKQYTDAAWTTAGEDAFNTDWWSSLNRAILTNGTTVQSSNKFYFGSMRNNTVASTTITLSGATAGNHYNISYDKGSNNWDQYVDVGSVDNGDGTFTATVRNTAVFAYIWTTGGNDLNSNATKEFADMVASCGANRSHTAGSTGADTWATCPATASTKDVVSSFSVYPNPINDIIEIRAAQAVHHVRIHDLTGKEVLRAAPNQAHFTLNTSALGKGVYLLSVVSDSNESTAKLVK